MDRRFFLQLFGASAVAALPGWRVGAQKRRIGIVGGGIIGASIAYHLGRRGAQVTLFERDRPASGATGSSFAWINAGFSKRPWDYYLLSSLGTAAYRSLDQELSGRLSVRWGSLQWREDADQAARLRQQVSAHQAWGYPIHLVNGAELRRLAPNLEPGPISAAAYAEQEASVDPVHVTQALLDAARATGVTVEHPCEVTSLDLRAGRLRGVRTTTRDLDLDVLVIAAGVDTPRLAAMVGLDVPLEDSPGLLAHTTPQTALLDQVVLSPRGHMKQNSDGRIVTGATFAGTPDLEPTRELGDRLLATATTYLPRLAEAELDRVTLGWRVLPRDGRPIVGFEAGAPDVYLAAMHSGVTLAPLIGRLASHEILDGVRVELLEPFRLSRFANGLGPA